MKKLLPSIAVIAMVLLATIGNSTANAWTANPVTVCDAGGTPDKWVQYVQEINPDFDPRSQSFLLTQNAADTDYYYLYQAHQSEDDPGGYQLRINYDSPNFSLVWQTGGGSGTFLIDIYRIDADGGADYALGTHTTTTSPVTDVSCVAINNTDGFVDGTAPDPEPDFQDYFEWLELQTTENRCVNETERSKWDSHCTDVETPPVDPPGDVESITFPQKAGIALAFILAGAIVVQFRYKGESS